MQHGYYVTRLSEHIGKTPEGYLIAKSVPLGRTGWQEYLGREIAPQDHDTLDDKMNVYRPEEEVFHPDALASFEGKTVTDSHPQDWVTPDNDGIYHRGHVQNVRRGTGEHKDHLLGDLVVKDPVLISKIENGLREVSCGYYCRYEPMGKNQFVQRDIRGNHVAVVPNGRAGDRIAIRDSQPDNNQTTKKVRTRGMKINLKTIFGLGLKEFAKDAEPEDLAEAHKLTANALKDADMSDEDRRRQEDEDRRVRDEEDKRRREAEDRRARDEEAEKRRREADDRRVGDRGVRDAEEEKRRKEAEDAAGNAGDGKEDRLLALLEKLVPVLERIASGGATVAVEKEPEEQLDEFANAFGGAEAPDDENLEAEQGQDGEAPFRDAQIESAESPVLSGKQLPQNPIPGADAKAVKDAIASLKPVIAALPDKASKQKAVDALINSFKAHRAPGRQPQGSYGQLLHLKSAKDALPQDDSGEKLGQDVKANFHRKFTK